MIESIQSDLDKKGFSIITNFRSGVECDSYRQLLENLNGNDVVNHENSSFHGSSVTMAMNILPHSSDFIDIACDPLLLQVAEGYFADGAHQNDADLFQLHIMHGRAVAIGAPDQGLHIDSRLCGVNPPIVLHAFLYLDDCLEEGAGATRVVPGSHKIRRYPTDADNDDAQPVLIKKGSILLLNSNLWHGSSRKQFGDRRWVITLAYSRWWVRQEYAIPYFQGWPRKLTKHEQNILGFNNYAETNRKRATARGALPHLNPHHES